MPFKLQPAEAYTVDISEVTDIERERLKVTFENGKELYFSVSSFGNASYPLLELDHSKGIMAGPGDGDELLDYLAQLFYADNIARSKLQHIGDWFLRTFARRHRPHPDWTLRTVKEQLLVELFGGIERRPSNLCVGRVLEVTYGTQYSNPVPYTILWGDVTSVESYVIPPRAVIVANYA